MVFAYSIYKSKSPEKEEVSSNETKEKFVETKEETKKKLTKTREEVEEENKNLIKEAVQDINKLFQFAKEKGLDKNEEMKRKISDWDKIKSSSFSAIDNFDADMMNKAKDWMIGFFSYMDDFILGYETDVNISSEMKSFINKYLILRDKNKEWLGLSDRMFVDEKKKTAPGVRIGIELEKGEIYAEENVTEFYSYEGPELKRTNREIITDDANIDTINIYDTRKGLKQAMFDIMNKDGGPNTEKLKKNKFGINLSAEHGLSGIVLYLEKNNKWESIEGMSGKKLKKYLKKKANFSYERRGGWDREYGKIAKILNFANSNEDFKEQLIEVAQLVASSKNVWTKSLIQRRNFGENIDQFDKNSIMPGLCDYDGSRTLAIAHEEIGITREEFHQQYLKEHKNDHGWRKAWKAKKREIREKNKEMKEFVGDVGSIFGTQLMDEIESAMVDLDGKFISNDWKDAYKKEYGFKNTKFSAKDVVYINILRYVLYVNNDDEELTKAVNGLITKIINQNDVSDLDQELYDLVKEHPNFQPLFATAIEEMNGAIDARTDNLHDALIGNVNNKQVIESVQEDPIYMIQKEVEAFFDSPEGKEVTKQMSADDIAYLRANLSTKIFKFLDNFEFQSNETNQGQEVDKWYVKHELFKSREGQALLQKAVKSFLGYMLSYDKASGTLTIGPSFSRKGTSKVEGNDWGRTIYDLNMVANFKMKLKGGSFKDNGRLNLVLRLGGAIARQFNFKDIITSSLDDVLNGKSSQYMGVRGEVVGGLANKAVSARGSVEYHRDREVAIEQRHKQFSIVMKDIVTLGDCKSCDKKTIGTMFEKKLEEIKTKKVNTREGKMMKKFIENNEHIIKSHMESYIKALELRNIFADLDGVEEEKKKYFLQQLLYNMVSSSMNSSMNLLKTHLNNKAKLTRLAVGISTGRMLALSATVSKYLTHYKVDKKQEYAITQALRRGTVFEGFNPKNINELAKYVQTRFVVPYMDLDKDGERDFAQSEILGGTPLIQVKADGNKLKITLANSMKDKGKKLSDVLNVRAKNDPDVLKNIQWTEDELIIGNVGNIDVETISGPKGVTNTLILGQIGTIDAKTKKANTVRLIEGHNVENTIDAGIEFENSDKWTQAMLDNIVDTSDIPTDKQILVKNLIKNSYNEGDGKIICNGVKKVLKGGTLTIKDGQITYEEEAGSNTLKIEYVEVGAQQAWTKARIEEKILDNSELVDVKDNILDLIDENGKLNDGSQIKNGTLTVTENADGNISATFEENSSSNTLVIKYKKASDIEEKEISLNNIDYTYNVALNKAIELLNSDSVIKALWEEENNDHDAYRKFWKYASNVGSGNYIDTEEISNASDELLKIIDNTSDTDVQTLKEYLNGNDILVKEEIVSRVKAILMIEPGSESLDNLRVKRGKHYLNLTGPSGQNFGENLKTYIKRIRDNYDGALTPNYNESIDTSLIGGFTAGYRRYGGNETEYRKYSSTPSFNTRVLADTKTEIEGDKEKKQAKEWLLGNLEKTEVQRELIAKTLSKKILVDISAEDVMILIREGKLDKDNGIHITLETVPVFYLLAECANESLGFDIKELKVVDESKVIKGEGDGREEKIYSGTGTLSGGMLGVVGGRHHVLSSSAYVERYDASATHLIKNDLYVNDVTSGGGGNQTNTTGGHTGGGGGNQTNTTGGHTGGGG